MHSLEEIECNYWKEKVGYACFQGVHGGWCISKLGCCSHCLWDWKSYGEDGWQIVNLFFPLDWHTKQLITLGFHDRHKAFCYEYKKPCPWKKLTFDMLPFNLSDIRFELQVNMPFMSLALGLLLALLCATMGRLHVRCKFLYITLFKFDFPSILLEF
jgi:hypothetical protein